MTHHDERFEDDADAHPRHTAKRLQVSKLRKAKHSPANASSMLARIETLQSWFAEQPSLELARLLMRTAALPSVRRIAVMPDAHVGHDVCNGCVIATDQFVYPQAVGQDIGCGFSAIALRGTQASSLSKTPRGQPGQLGQADQLLAAMRQAVPILKHAAARDPSNCWDASSTALLSENSLRRIAERDGALQHGTLGRGNHFAELQHDDEGTLWLLVHAGSRCLGPAILARHLAHAQWLTPARTLGRSSEPAKPIAALEQGTPACDAYLRDAQWATAYASTGRLRMLLAIAKAINAVLPVHADRSTLIDSPHNTVGVEEHNGKQLVVHRKGAARARAGEPGVIAGTAGTFSVHTSGRGCEASLQSCSHGAGRVLTRSAARREISPRSFATAMGDVTFDERATTRMLEEAPQAYRDLRVVLAAQRELVATTRVLRPLVSFR